MAYFVSPEVLIHMSSATLVFKKLYPFRTLILALEDLNPKLMALGIAPRLMITKWWGLYMSKAPLILWLRFIRFEPVHGALTAPGPPYYFREPMGEDSLRNIFFNGVVHWPACTPEHPCPFRHFFVSFDMEDEVFCEMAMPKTLQGEETFEFFMSVVDGLLAVIPNRGNQEDMPVWVMKEYGRAESWTKQFDIKFEYGSYGAIGFTKNSEVLVEHEGDLCSYKRNSEQSWYLHIYDISDWLFFDTYVESTPYVFFFILF
jgi:hypothetical protein